jgi:mannose/fructose/N-acetylgalactosamine-specific phosphotransferase system component IIC
VRWLVRMTALVVCLAAGAILGSAQTGLLVGVIVSLTLDAVLTLQAVVAERRGRTP